MTNEELCARANRIVNELFGFGKQKRKRGPSSDLFLFNVSWKDKQTGINHSKMFKHKKQAQVFAQTMRAENDGKVGLVKQRYDCYFIYEEGLEEMWQHYEIQDWSFKEFKAYVEYHKNF